VTYQGKLYGMPWYNSAKHLFYNAKLLKDAGFDKPPTTLDELVAQPRQPPSPVNGARSGPGNSQKH